MIHFLTPEDAFDLASALHADGLNVDVELRHPRVGSARSPSDDALEEGRTATVEVLVGSADEDTDIDALAKLRRKIRARGYDAEFDGAGSLEITGPWEKKP